MKCVHKLFNIFFNWLFFWVFPKYPTSWPSQNELRQCLYQRIALEKNIKIGQLRISLKNTRNLSVLIKPSSRFPIFFLLRFEWAKTLHCGVRLWSSRALLSKKSSSHPLFTIHLHRFVRSASTRQRIKSHIDCANLFRQAQSVAQIEELSEKQFTTSSNH